MAYFPPDYPEGRIIIVWFDEGRQRAVWVRTQGDCAQLLCDANDIPAPASELWEWEEGFSVETRFEFIDAERSAQVMMMRRHGVPLEKWLAVLGLTTVSKG